MNLYMSVQVYRVYESVGFVRKTPFLLILCVGKLFVMTSPWWIITIPSMHEPIHDRTGVYTLRERGFCMENAKHKIHETPQSGHYPNSGIKQWCHYLTSGTAIIREYPLGCMQILSQIRNPLLVSTNFGAGCLTSVIGRVLVYSTCYGRWLCTWLWYIIY